MQENWCKRLATSKQWEKVKGMKSSALELEGWAFDAYYDHHLEIDQGNARLIAVEEHIKKAVMRT